MEWLDETWRIVSNWGTAIASIIYGATILFIVTLIILENRHPVKTIAWVLVLVLLPVLGIIHYLFFGIEYRKRKLFSRKELKDLQRMERFSQIQLKFLPDNKYLEDPDIRAKRHIITLLLNNSKAILTRHNHVEILQNGSATFSEIIEAIKSAKEHIHIEYYIYSDDKIGNKIKDLLIEKAEQGVQVRFIYDSVGSWGLKRKFRKSLKDAGVEIYPFLPVKFPLFASKINYRNHRKIVVVDGKIGFVGGVNIADRYAEGHPKIGFWRDTHLKVQGDAVHSLQSVFLTDWYFSSKQVVQGLSYFPHHEIEENHLVQITASGPDSDWASIMQAYFSAIATAKDHVYISTPYFIPNESILTALKSAAMSGVDVRLLLPSKSDVGIYLWSSQSYVEILLESGVKVYFYDKGLNHGKIMMVDGVFASVGTANMDIRSFDQNFEVNALVYDKEITQLLENDFLEDLEDSTRIYLETYSKRPLRHKVRESLSRIFSPLL